MPTEEPLVDLTQFQALAGGEKAVPDLASFYIPYVAERLDALRSAVTAGAADRVETIARHLAGANAAAGVTDIVAPLVTLERMARTGVWGWRRVRSSTRKRCSRASLISCCNTSRPCAPTRADLERADTRAPEVSERCERRVVH